MFEQAKEGLEKALEAKTQEVEAPKEVSEQTEKEQPKVLELDSLERFKFDGREWSPKDFKNAYLMQSDYTKKTKELAEERKFAENFAFDAASVFENPALIEQFKQVYPKKYVEILESQLGKFAPKKEQAVASEAKIDLPPELKSKLEKLDLLEKDLSSIKQKDFEKEVATIEAQIDTIFKKMNEKYPWASEEVVISRAQALLDKGMELSEKSWEDLFKSTNDQFKQFAESRYKETINKQKEAHEKGKDVGPGGGIPGQAPKKESFKEATERAIRELSAR